MTQQLEESSNGTNSLSIDRSKTEFDAFVKSFIQQENVDPRYIQDSIDNYTERFDRLKFLFLEQEAKEQFLRLILEQNTKVIDREEILKSVDEAEELKNVSRAKEEKIDSLTSDIIKTAHEVHVNKGKLDEIEKDLSKIIPEVNEKREILKRVTEDLNEIRSSDPSLDRLREVKQKNPSLDLNPEELSSLTVEQLKLKIQQVKSERLLLSERTKELNSLKKKKTEEAQTQKDFYEKLVSTKEKLSQSIDEIQKSNTTENQIISEQKKTLVLNEAKLKVLSELWNKITIISSYKFADSTFTFKFKGFEEDCKIKITKDEKIEIIEYSKLDGLKLEEIKNIANSSKVPVHHASELIYNEIISS